MSNGMHYAPVARSSQPVCAPGEFVMAAMALDHGHIYGMVDNLIQAGATLKYVYDPDPRKVAYFCKRYPTVQVANAA